MKAIAASFLLILALHATRAAADEDAPVTTEHVPRPWSVAARTSYARMGPAARPTGGMMISGDLLRSWQLGERYTLAVGGELAAVGFDTGARWVGLLGGVEGVAAARIAGPVSLGAALHLDAGRLPTCTPWGWCMLYSGLFPALTADVRYEPSPRVALALGGGPRWIRTLAWSGAGLEGFLSALGRF